MERTYTEIEQSCDLIAHLCPTHHRKIMHTALHEILLPAVLESLVSPSRLGNLMPRHVVASDKILLCDLLFHLILNGYAGPSASQHFNVATLSDGSGCFVTLDLTRMARFSTRVSSRCSRMFCLYPRLGSNICTIFLWLSESRPAFGLYLMTMYISLEFTPTLPLFALYYLFSISPLQL